MNFTGGTDKRRALNFFCHKCYSESFSTHPYSFRIDLVTKYRRTVSTNKPQSWSAEAYWLRPYCRHLSRHAGSVWVVSPAHIFIWSCSLCYSKITGNWIKSCKFGYNYCTSFLYLAIWLEYSVHDMCLLLFVWKDITRKLYLNVYRYKIEVCQ